MKVMFIPDARGNNVYQTNLSNSLLKQGVEVFFDGGNVIQSIVKNRPNVVHVHWPNYFMITGSKLGTYVKSTFFIVLLSTLKLFGVKIVWTVHNLVGHDGKFRSEELLFSKFLAHICNRLIVHCPSAEHDVKETYGKNLPISVIPHGSYIDYYENTITSLDARDKLKLNEEDMVFLYFGQVRPYKGVIELIDAFKKLDCQNARLLIVGKPFNKETATDINNSCGSDSRIRTILEFVPDEDIQIYMNAADVVILPYKNILTSGAAILAMSFGKPIVAPAVKCIADTFDENGGFLYQKTESLVNVIRRVLNENRKTLKSMGEYNLKLARRLSWDDIAKMTRNVYRNHATK